jgi:hypothetical protein
VFDLKAAQRRMHLDLRGAAGCPRWEGEPEDEAGGISGVGWSRGRALLFPVKVSFESGKN